MSTRRLFNVDLRLNCDAALANLSTRTCISVALCDITALSSVKNNSLVTIRLFLVLVSS